MSLSGVTRVVTNVQTTATWISLILNFFCLIVLFSTITKLRIKRINKWYILNSYLIYSVLILFYSFFVSNSYDQYRYILTVYFPSIALSTFSILGIKPFLVFKFFKYYIYISMPISLILYFSGIDGMSDFTHYLSFIYILILLMPFLEFKWNIIIVFFSVLSFFYDLGSRSNLFNLGFVSFLLMVNCFNYNLKINILKFLRIFFIFSPFVFLLSSFIFKNTIFKTFEGFTIDYSITGKSDNELSLSTDTRSDVYKDAISSVLNEKYLLFGLSAGRYHKTFLKNVDAEGYYDFYKKGRLGSEVGILEYLLRGGLIYVFIITLIHFYASKFGLFNSRNILSKFFAVFIAFRFFFLFIEGQPILNLSNISIFLVIGLCLNKVFRNFSDLEIKIHLNKIFG